MGQQIQVNMLFNADTTQATSKVQGLYNQLNKLSNAGNLSNLSGSMANVSAAAATLQKSLAAATNMETGKLKLVDFNNQLKITGMSMSSYATSFAGAGKAGAESFTQLAKCVADAEVPTIKFNSALSNIGKTLTSAAKWTFAYGIINGITNSMQSAYNYAQKLDKSLNNIRIVTGQTNDQMATFAKNANVAAQALSTTTNEYAKASLIYYQQGLDDAAVKERTDTTIKMANVTGDSASTVSEQMTAIWNNFDDGTKSLEYYADAITALGASTASSTDEIATGLSKFASVAETAGLSYEYAAAALATITAETRQSADTVGTGLRTVLSRIESLNLGETLDDDVDLNKYTKALNSIGVSVLDTNGQLKSANDILDQMAGKWQNLTNAQKMATAETIGGVRQYTTITALMENWDKMQTNVQTALSSSGTLQKQQEIYAESWEASKERVTAAAEDIYKSLISDKFFIWLNDVSAEILKGVKKFTDAFGGLKGLLGQVFSMVIFALSKNIQPAVDKLNIAIQGMSQKGLSKIYSQFQAEVEQESTKNNYNSAQQQELQNAAQIMAIKKQLVLVNGDLTQSQKQQIEFAISGLELQQNELVKIKQEMIDLQKSVEIFQSGRLFDNFINELYLLKNSITEAVNSSNTGKKGSIVETSKIDNKFNELKSQVEADGKEIVNQFIKINKDISNSVSQFTGKELFSNVISGMKQIQKACETAGDGAKTLKAEVLMYAKTLPKVVRESEKVQKAIEDIDKITNKDDLDTGINNLLAAIEETTIPAESLRKILEDFGINTGSLQQLTEACRRLGYSEEEAKKKAEELQNTFKGLNLFMNPGTPTLLTQIMSLGSALTSTAMLINSFKSLFTTITNPDVSGLEKLTTILMSIGMILNNTKSLIEATTRAQILSNAVTKLSQTNLNKAAAGLMNFTFTLDAEKDKEIEAAIARKLAWIEIIAIIAIVSAVVYTLIKAWNKDADAAKKAAEEMEKAKQSFEDANEAYNELINDIKDYKDAQKAIDELTVGTEEWKKAIQDANMQILELMDAYKGLGQFIRSDNGRLVIEESGYKYLEEQAKNDLQSSQLNYQASSIRSNLASNQSAITDYIRANKITSEEDLKAVIDAYNKYGNTIFTDFSTFTDSVKLSGGMSSQKQLYELKDSLIELIASLNNNTKANQISADQMAQLEVEKNGLDNTKYSEQIANVISNKVNKLSVGSRDNWETNYLGENDETVQKRYAELRGWQWVSNNTTGNGTYRDKQGKEQTIDDTTVRYVLNYQDAINKIGADSQIILNSLESISSVANQISQGTSNAVLSFVEGGNGTFDSLTSSQAQEYKKYFNEDTYKKGAEPLLDSIIDNYSTLGYESAQSYYDALKKGINDYQETEKVLTDNFSTTIQNAFNNINVNDLSLGDKKTILNLLDSQFTKFGTASMNNLSALLSSAGKEAGKFAAALNDVDWTNVDSIANIEKIARESGVDTTSQEWREYVQTLQDACYTASNLLNRFNSLKETLTTINKITKDVKFGSIISEDDYKTLIKFNSGLKELFILTADGYKFIGSNDDLKNAFNLTMADLDQMKLELSDAYRAGEKLSNYTADFSTSSWKNDGNNYYAGQAVSFDSKKATIQDMLNGTNADEELLNEILEKAELSRTKLIEAINNNDENTLEQFWTAAGKLQSEYEQGLYNSINAEELWVSSQVESISELNGALNDGTISEETYEKTLRSVAKLQAETAGLDFDEVETQAILLARNLDLDTDAAYSLAIANAKMNKGLKTIQSNFEKWNKTLNNSSNTSSDYAATIDEMSEALANLIGFDSKELIDLSIFDDTQEILTLMEQAANGSAEAINQLGVKATTAAFKGMKPLYESSEAFTNAIGNDSISEKLQTLMANAIENFETYQGQVLNGIQTISNAANGANLVEALESEDAAQEWVESLNQMAIATGMSVAEMQSYLNGLGLQANVTTDYIQTTSSVPEYETEEQDVSTREDLNAGLHRKRSSTRIVGYKSVPQVMEVAQVAYNKDTSPITIKRASGLGLSQADNSSKTSSSTPKYADKKSDSDKERYHTIKNQIEDLKDIYDDVSKAKDRAFGQNRIDYIDQEIEATDNLIKKQEEYISYIKNDFPVDKGIMTSYASMVLGGFQIAFDELGNISNFDSLQEAMINKWNSMASIYTSDSTEWQVFEKQYEQLKDYIDQYETTYDLLREQENYLQELRNQLIDEQLEKIQTAIELKVNVADDSLKLLEYQIGKLEDSAYDAAQAIALFGEQAELIYDKIEADRKGLIDTLALSTSEQVANMIVNGTFTGNLEDLNLTDAQIKDIKNYRDGILELNSDLDDLRDNVQEKVNDVFEDFNNKLKTGVDLFDEYNSILENYQNIIGVVGKKYLNIDNDLIKNLRQTTVDNRVANLKSLNTIYKTQIENFKQAQQALNDAISRGNETDIKKWQEQLQTLQEKVNEANQDMLSSWQEALEAASSAFEASVEDAISNFEKALSSFDSLEQLSEVYGRQSELVEQYLPDYQKIYELSKLQRDINNTIDDTDNIAGKQKLAKLLEKLNKYQEDGVEMSAYDLEYLQKEYELRKAEIALEEAQNAKDTVRLRRDNEGNYGYVYTANEDAVNEAQQKYEDALYAMQELSSNYINEMSDQLIQTSIEMEEALANIRAEDYASIEEYYAKLDEVASSYQEQLQNQQDEMQKAIDNNKVLYQEDWTNYSEMTGYKISDTERFMTSYKDTILGTMMDATGDIVNFVDNINEQLGDSDVGLISQLLDAYEQWKTNTDAAMGAAGTSAEDFADSLAATTEMIATKSQEAVDYVDNMAQQMEEGFGYIVDSVTNWQDAYSNSIDNAINDNLRMIENVNNLISVLSGVEESATLAGSAISSLYSNNGLRLNTAASAANYEDSETSITSKLSDYESLLVNNVSALASTNAMSSLLSTDNIGSTILDVIDKTLSYYTSSLAAITATGFNNYISNLDQTLQQEVTIEANFPNVSDRNEIEEAFENLINTAAQYANRK